MKTNAIVRICIYSLLILLLLGLLFSVMNVSRFLSIGWHEDSSLSSLEIDDPTEIPADQVRAIDIDWAAGDILIRSGDTKTVTVTESKSSGQKPMEVSLKNGQLEIDYQEDDLKFGFGIHMDMHKDLTITVPRDLVLREIELDIASAEVEIRDLAGTVSQVDIDAASGTCLMENCAVGTLDVDTASGDITFRGSLNNLNFDAASAEFVGEFTNHPSVLKLDGMSGDMEITLPKGCGFTATVDALSSRFDAQQEIQMINGAYVHGDGGTLISVNGMSGDVNIRQGK